MEIDFSRRTKKFHLYHCENGEFTLKWLTRFNVLFIGGNSILLACEMISPLFGYWHGIYEALTVGMSLVGSYALNYYSTRFINDVWLMEDGKTVEVEFLNAFFPTKR